MQTYRVWVAKTRYYFTEIDAESRRDAQNKALERIDQGLEVSYTNDDDEIEVYLIEDISK
jgi:hypothetical protein